jgi:hypothetical protein
MKNFGINVALAALLAGVAGFSTPSRAETGQVAVVFTKGGFIAGVGGGEGVLTFRGKRYPFTNPRGLAGMGPSLCLGQCSHTTSGRLEAADAEPNQRCFHSVDDPKVVLFGLGRGEPQCLLCPDELTRSA